MQKAERRNKQRITSINLMNYVSLDQNYHEVSQGMGKTINLSETGVLIETTSAIDPNNFLSLNIGLADEQFKVHGKVVYTDSFAENNYRTGIRFNQAPRAGYYIFKNMLAALQEGTTIGNKISDKPPLTIMLPHLKGPKSDYLYVVDEETYLGGERIVTQGNFGNWVWVILDGWATTIRETSKGSFDIFKLGPGAFIGSSMSYLATKHARTNTIIASETVQLGLIDTQQMIAEHAALSPEFREIILSLSGRLKRIIDRIVSLKQGKLFFKEDLLSENVISKSAQNNFGLHNIVRGKATMLHRGATGEIPIVNLYPGDYLGSLSFVKNHKETDFCIVRASTGLKSITINRENIEKEYENLSQTFKNMIEFTTLKFFTAAQLVKQLNIKKSQIH